MKASIQLWEVKLTIKLSAKAKNTRLSPVEQVADLTTEWNMLG